MITVLFLFFTSAIWFIMFRYRRRHMYKMAALFPKFGTEMPGIGIAYTLSGRSMEDIMVIAQNASYEAMQKGGIVKAWFGPLLYFLAVDPVDVEMVLKSCLEKDYMYQFLKASLGNGTITAPVSIWGRRRKVLDRIFTLKTVESTVGDLFEKSEMLTKVLGKCADLGKVINIYSFDFGVGSAMDMQVYLESVMKAIGYVERIISERIFSLWFHPDWLFRLFPQSHEFKMKLAVIHKYTDKKIREARKSIEEYKTITGVKPHPRSCKTVAELLLTLSGDDDEGYTDEELREELITLTVAGTETTAVTIGFTLILLGKYPEVQDKLYQELHDVFGDSERALVKEDLKKLYYLDRVVKESLRLFPPVPLVARKVFEDTKLPSGRVLPGGSSFCISIWGVHRDPKYWGPDAENFDPDRFLPERLNLAHACSYMPFSYGRRNCVAYRYALLSEKTLLATIIRRYRVVGDIETSPAPQLRVKFDIAMKAVDGLELQLEKRK